MNCYALGMTTPVESRPIARRLAIVSTIAAGLMTASASQPPPKGDEPTRGREVYYTAIVGTNSPEFDEGKANPGILAGKPMSATVIQWVNGDPVGLFGGGILIWPLKPFLRAGRNELTFSGTRTEPIYVVIPRARAKNDELLGIAGKKKFLPPSGDKLDSPLVFEVAPAPEFPDRELLGQTPRDRVTQEKEARALVDRLQLLMRKHQGEAAVRLLNEGRMLREVAEEQGDAFETKLKDSAKRISDPGTRIVDAERVTRVVFGKRAVLVYGEVADRPEKGHSLFSVQDGKEKLTIGPLVLARINGRWLIWYS